MKIRHGMALAAGLGLRLRPITNHTPKPLVTIGGRTMLDRVLDHFAAAGVTEAVVNVHWLGDRIRDHLAVRDTPHIAISDETDTLLETGGGVSRALPQLGQAPFYVANSDIVWTDGPRPALARLAEAWHDGLDALLLLQDTRTAWGYDGAGDFFLEGATPRRRGTAASAPLLFSGVQILHPRLFAGAPEGKFSLNLLYDKALGQGRLGAVLHDGGWYHVGTPDALAQVQREFGG
jgi:MurNAc alpha-1-phosphate uridylyltransferase